MGEDHCYLLGNSQFRQGQLLMIGCLSKSGLCKYSEDRTILLWKSLAIIITAAVSCIKRKLLVSRVLSVIGKLINKPETWHGAIIGVSWINKAQDATQQLPHYIRM